MKPTRKTILATIAFIALTLAIVAGTHYHIDAKRAESIDLAVQSARFGHQLGSRGETWQQTEAALREQIRRMDEAR